MHQFALALIGRGIRVYGYDIKPNKYTQLCVTKGMIFSKKFEKSFLNVDFCIYSGAIKPNNRYLCALKKQNVLCIDRAQALQYFATKFKTVIAVAGTHGKSTTASLIYQILQVAGKKVSCHIGADVKNARFNFGDDFLVVEACEYNKSFLSLNPHVCVVTNVEAEHMDCYKNMFSLRAAFSTFLKRGKMRFVGDDKSNQFLLKINGVIQAKPLNLTNLKPKLLGDYNKKNICLAFCVCQNLGISPIVIVKAINSFVGVNRRYQFITDYAGANVYIDYAHHPTEIGAFASTFLSEHQNSLIVFQPHTYSRTKTFLNDFVRVLKNVPNLIIYKEYPAREKKDAGLSAYQLFCQLKSSIQPTDMLKNLHYCTNLKSVLKHFNNYDALAFVGAGDVDKLAYKLKSIKSKL